MSNDLDVVILGDALRELPKLPDSFVDCVITDPPYFLDQLDDHWDHNRFYHNNSGVVKTLPGGMKFDREHGKRLYHWFYEVSKECYRILKPGGFFFVFSSPRLMHRITSSIDDAGFNIRDVFLWLYTTAQPKAMSLHHFVQKMDIPDEDKKYIIQKTKNWKTPQVKSVFEPIVVAQKPCENTFLENFLKHNVGLFNTSIKVGENMFPANILMVEGTETILDKYFLIQKPKKGEKGTSNDHPTVKPVELIKHLILLSTVEGAIVLDPFAGSGTTAVAAMQTNRHFICIEINPHYHAIINRRIQNQREHAI